MPMTADIVEYISANLSQWVIPDGSNPAGNIFQSLRPSEPDRIVSVHQLPGSKPKRTLGKGFAWEEPRLQIYVRNAVGQLNDTTTGFPAAEADARQIWNLLRAVVNQTVNGTRYMIIDPDGEPSPIELDPNNRPLIVMEFSVMKYLSD
jgi:hypothetical protein